MPLRRLAIVSLALIAALPGSPLPRPALAQSQDPCAAALAAEGATAMRTPPGRASKYGRFGADTRDVRDLVQRLRRGVAEHGHARHRQSRGPRPIATRTTSRSSKTTAAT